MNTSTRVSKQTMLDAHSWPKLRTRKKDADTGGTDAPKEKSKKKKPATRSTRADSEEERTDKGDTDGDETPKRTILSVAEGRAFLEEEALIDAGEGVDIDMMVSTLIQVSLMKGMSETASHAVRAVALILTQLKMEAVSEALVNSLEKKLANMVAKEAEKATSLIKGSLESTMVEIQAASTNMTASATQSWQWQPHTRTYYKALHPT